MSTKRTYKFGTKAFFEKTPSLYRRIGNMFFSISSLGGTFAFLAENKSVGIILFAMGVLGKALTEFFSQEELEKDYDVEDEFGEDDSEPRHRPHRDKGGRGPRHPYADDNMDIIAEDTSPEKDQTPQACD